MNKTGLHASDHAPWFGSTRWSIVLQAGQSDAPEATVALSQLCTAYWHPLYRFIRCQGYNVADAEDLTQGFFARFLEKKYLKAVAPEKGRFRSFLLAAVKHYLSDERDRARAQKRGGGATHVPIDTQAAEKLDQDALNESMKPETAFDRTWALTVLAAAKARLHERYEKSGKLNRFKALAPYLQGEEDTQPYGVVAHQLGLNEIAVKAEVRRLRLRFRDCLRAEVAHTVVNPDDVDDELRYLIRAI